MSVSRNSSTKLEIPNEKTSRQHTMNLIEKTDNEPHAQVDQLLHGNPNLWRGCDMAGRGFHGVSTGFPELDDILPGHFWALGYGRATAVNSTYALSH